MIRNPSMLESFEQALVRREPPDHRRNLRIFEALYLEALALGVFPPQNPLDGIEVDTLLAGVLNARGTVREDRDRT